jgi:hypothetical protein
MLNKKNFQIMESQNMVFAPRVTGKRYTVLVRSGNVIFKGEGGPLFSYASVPDMDLHVIEFKDVSYIVNVISYKNMQLGNESIVDRLNKLSDKELELLKMKVIQFYPLKEIYPFVVDEVVYRHVIDDNIQGLLSKIDIDSYRQYIASVVVMEQVKKQKIELSLIEAETVMIVIDLQPECKKKICAEKQLSDCKIEVIIRTDERDKFLELYKFFNEVTEPEKKQKKNKKKIRKLAIRYYRFLMFIQAIETKKFVIRLDEAYKEHLIIQSDNIRRSLTDEGGTLIVLL